MIIAFKIIFETIIWLILVFLLLLLSRVPLCDDIEESAGRHVFRNKRKKNKRYPNRIKWFFLWDYLPYIKKWHYVFFILDVLFSLAVVAIIMTITTIGWSPSLKVIGEIVFSISLIIKIIISYFPRDKYRKKKRKLS